MIRELDVLVVGGGPAGIAAAAGARRAGAARVAIAERGAELGGILLQCPHSGFGSILYGRDLPGPAYAARAIAELAGLGVELLLGATVLDLSPGLVAYASSAGAGFLELRARAVVLAMGCRERTAAQVALSGERLAGVYTAGTAQRMVNVEGWMPGERFVVLGSGDIGMIMARRLVLEGARVEAVVEARPWLTGLRRNYVQCLEDFGIPLELSSTVTGVRGSRRVEAVEVARVDAAMRPLPAGPKRTIPCDGLLLSVGLVPENELSRRAGVELDPLTGGPFVDAEGHTSVPGVFAVGNVQAIHDQADQVSLAGYRVGAAAASYAPDGGPHRPGIALGAGQGISQVFPQRFSPARAASEGLSLSFRVRAPSDAPVLFELVSPEGRTIPLARRPYARPAEMIVAELRKEEIAALASTRSLELRAVPGAAAAPEAPHG